MSDFAARRAGGVVIVDRWIRLLQDHRAPGGAVEMGSDDFNTSSATWKVTDSSGRAVYFFGVTESALTEHAPLRSDLDRVASLGWLERWGADPPPRVILTTTGFAEKDASNWP